MNQEYISSDDIVVSPDEYNNNVQPQRTMTIRQQLDFLKQQTALLKQSVALEKQVQIEDPLGYIHLLQNNLQSLSQDQFHLRLEALARLTPSAEQQVTIKCQLPDGNNLKRFQQLEQSIAELESIIGKKQYIGSISGDLLDINKQLNVQMNIQVQEMQLPAVDQYSQPLNTIQMLLGISDLIPKINDKLEQLKQAHEMSAGYQKSMDV